jgi:hypothetical protein
VFPHKQAQHTAQNAIKPRPGPQYSLTESPETQPLAKPIVGILPILRILLTLRVVPILPARTTLRTLPARTILRILLAITSPGRSVPRQLLYADASPRRELY